MVSIKLSRVGKKKLPQYRIIVCDRRKDPWGNFLEIVGFYNPLKKPKIIELKKERISYWLSVGAQPTATVHNLLVDADLLKKAKKKASKKKAKKEETDKKEGDVRATVESEKEAAKAEKPEVEEKDKKDAEAAEDEKPKQETKEKAKEDVNEDTQN